MSESAEAHISRAAELRQQGRLDEALAAYDDALALTPEDARLYNWRGNVFLRLNRFDAAQASYERAVALKADFAQAHNNLGNVLSQQGRLAAAVESYDQAVRFNPDSAETFANRGYALVGLGQHAAAVASFDRALALKPDIPYLAGVRVNAKTRSCDWSNIEADIADLAARIMSGERVCPALAILALVDDPAAQRKCAETWLNHLYPAAGAPAVPAPAANQKIRIGYYSSDFQQHAVATLAAGLFEHHDRSRFEVTAFSFGRDAGDDMRRRLVDAFDHFHDARALSDAEVVARSRAAGIDIAVDLNGITQGCRPGVFARRTAPVQVSYLGYPGTMAVDYMDYLIADPIVVPRVKWPHYSEKIVHMPGSYQVNDAARPAPASSAARSAHGLPDQGFVFCCFNSSHKILPATFAGWMRILQRVPESVLWLLADGAAADNLRREAERHGVSSARLVFAARLPPAEHMARHGAADLFLDTLPYNAHTTASDALWAGVPVLTCAGESFAARVGASLLTAVGLPELITTSPQAYEALAVELASTPERLADMKQKLIANRNTADLFDTKHFTRRLEEAYIKMYSRLRAGLAPDNIVLAPES